MQSNVLFVAFAELLIIIGSIRLLMRPLYRNVDFFEAVFGPEYAQDFHMYFWYFIPLAVSILFMRLTCRGVLKGFTEGSKKRKLGSAGKGLLLGCVINCIPTLCSALTGGITFRFNRVTPMLLPLFVLVFIQCCSEEFMLRGYVPAVLGTGHKWDTVAFVSGVLFIFHHIGNMEMLGFNAIFCLNVFLVGVMLVLLVKKDGNFWICCGFHCGWNFTQQFVMGLPNSGLSSNISIVQGEAASDTFFFNTVYGNEGALCTTLVTVVMIILLIDMTAKDKGKEITLQAS